MSKKIFERKDIKKEHKWDLESIYDGLESWKKDFDKAIELGNEFQKHKGEFIKSPQGLLQALKDRDDLYRVVSLVYSYAHMKLDEDTRNPEAQDLSDRAMRLIVETNEKTAFLTPEMLTIEDEKLEGYLEKNKDLRLYKHHMKDILRLKAHTLSPREELILAQAGEIGNSPSKIYSMFNNADLTFPKVKNEDGEEVEITQGNFVPLLQSKNMAK